MTTPEAYRLADETIKRLNKRFLQLVEQAKRRLMVVGFDELNVIKQVDALYADMYDAVKKELISLYGDRYMEVLLWLAGEDKAKDVEDEIDELAEMYIAGLLDNPNETTHYTFSAEALRKRDRAKEAVLSVPTKTQKQAEMQKQVRFWAQMVGWYVDFTSQDAEIQAMTDAGVKKVQRHEMEDMRTCQTCIDADGEIYDIHRIPPIPHLRCRRWFTPVYGK